MTDLTKPVRRRTVLDPKLGRQEAGEISVTLYPSGDIGFRRLKRRSEVRLPLASVYAMALKAEAEAQRRAKKTKRKLRKAGY